MSSPRPEIRVQSATGTTSTESRELLSQRLIWFGRFGFWLTAAYQAVHHLILYVLPDLSEFFKQWFAVGWVTLLLPVVFAFLWAASRGRDVSLARLRALDAASIFLTAVLFAFAGIERGNALGSFFPMAHLLTIRAVIVPSAGRRTLILSLVSYVPIVVTAGLYGVEQWDPSQPAITQPSLRELTTSELTLLAVRCCFSVAIATVVSHVIYQLRQQVRDARELGQYRLEERIGEGGMGEIYKARHALLRRPTAIKLLRPEKSGEISIARFEREVQLTSQLTHPNTIVIYDYGHTEDGVFYYAMEYLPGLDLAALVGEDGPQPPARVIHLLRQACGSLAEAHRAGLVHRDIKPENMILYERGGEYDALKVLDFGLVKDVRPNVTGEGEAALTGSSIILGTPHYLPPEALVGSDKVRPPGYLYALGALGYFLLTGETPFSGANFLEISLHHLNTKPDTPSSRLGRPIAEDLEKLILSCLEKKVDARPVSAEALGEALGRCEDAGGWGQPEARAWWEKRKERKGTSH